jgi:hypothetical protein
MLDRMTSQERVDDMSRSTGARAAESGYSGYKYATTFSTMAFKACSWHAALLQFLQDKCRVSEIQMLDSGDNERTMYLEVSLSVEYSDAENHPWR